MVMHFGSTGSNSGSTLGTIVFTVFLTEITSGISELKMLVNIVERYTQGLIIT
jgi:hypothetical protein